MGKEVKYYSGDPFFVVTCDACGAEYWSTRRLNEVCAKCGVKNPITHLPDYIKGVVRDSE